MDFDYGLTLELLYGVAYRLQRLEDELLEAFGTYHQSTGVVMELHEAREHANNAIKDFEEEMKRLKIDKKGGQ